MSLYQKGDSCIADKSGDNRPEVNGDGYMNMSRGKVKFLLLHLKNACASDDMSRFARKLVFRVFDQL